MCYFMRINSSLLNLIFNQTFVKVLQFTLVKQDGNQC